MNKRTVILKSSVLNSVEYNDVRQDLTVNFKSGKQYIYTPVSEQLLNKLVRSESQGKFFNRNIRDNEALTCLKVIK